MRQNLLHPRSRLSITQWLERSLLSFWPVSVNQAASYCSRRAGRKNQMPSPIDPSAIFGKHLLMDEKLEENRVLSPFSFQLVLSLLAAGSAGFTRRQLVKFFGVDSVGRLNRDASQICGPIMADAAVGPRMRCSTGLWLDQSLTLKASFKQILDSHYRAGLNPADFQAKATNEFLGGNETSGLVKDLIREGSLNSSVKLVFTNALYFKGAWRGESLPCLLSNSQEEQEDFDLDPFSAAMSKEEFGRWHRGYTMLIQQFKKPRKDERDAEMYFCFPGIDAEDGRRSLVRETLMDAGGHTTPKLNITSEMEACDALRGLGVTLPFSGGKLTEMLSRFNGRKLYVLSIFQKSVLEMNEQETEAASASTVIVTSGCPPSLPPVPTIRAEPGYPFFFHGGLLAAKTDSAFMALCP
ncbi:serpin-ZX-like [Neltuma alba]|uniref:serpin-ZX-like n=1 Tax=Neltuma alba TaxID=207710 RepID=UPI0010A4A628|nr:serpin-ZX-like [Prosopis alba]